MGLGEFQNVHGKIGIQDGGCQFRDLEDLIVRRPRGDEQAQPDEMGSDPGQVGPDSAGQSGDAQELSSIADAADASVQELADSDQAREAGIVDGVEDAADHPERPVHTHLEYGRPDDLPPRFGAGEFDEESVEGRLVPREDEVDVEDLPDEKTA
jgi:hypothetical protein